MNKLKIFCAVFIALLVLVSCDDSKKNSDNNLLLLLAMNKPDSFTFVPSAAVLLPQETWFADGPFALIGGLNVTIFSKDTDNFIALGVSSSAAINTNYDKDSALWNMSIKYKGNLFNKDTGQVITLRLSQNGSGRITGTVSGRLWCTSPATFLRVEGSFSCAL
jgi:hypothetical protein